MKYACGFASPVSADVLRLMLVTRNRKRRCFKLIIRPGDLSGLGRYWGSVRHTAVLLDGNRLICSTPWPARWGSPLRS
jgi:hypothetical protein